MRKLLTRRRVLAGGTCLAALAAIGVYGQAFAEGEPVKAQILSITDFHRQLEPPAPEAGGEIYGPGGEKITVGGAVYLAAHLNRLREGAGNSLLLSAGDQFGGYPFESWEFQDEPTVEALNTMGVDVSTVGNHELDNGVEYLFDHATDGGCFGEVGVDSCFDDSTGEKFHGSDFDVSSANLFGAESQELLADPYVIKQVTGSDGKKYPIGIINGTKIGTEKMQASYATEFATTDVAEAVNKYAAELKDKGVEAIIANLHEGARPANANAPYDSCDNPKGPMVDANATITPDVDAIVGGHLHTNLNCSLPDPAGNPRFLVEAGKHGGLINEMNLAIDPATGDVIREESTSKNHPVTRDIAPDPKMEKLADYWIGKGEERAAAEVATNSGDISRDKDDSGESTLGNWAADVNLAAADSGEAKADFAVVATESHKGATSLNGDMYHAKSEYPGDADGRITAFEVWKAYGFGNPILTVSLTGAQIDAGLEQQWTDTKFAPLAVSSNVKYGYDASAAIGGRVEPADVSIDGAALDPDKTYRVAMISYTAVGSDGFAAFKDFTDVYRGPTDQWFVREYLEKNPNQTPPDTDRVSVK